MGLLLHRRDEAIPTPTGCRDIPWCLRLVLQGAACRPNAAAQGIIRDELVRSVTAQPDVDTPAVLRLRQPPRRRPRLLGVCDRAPAGRPGGVAGIWADGEAKPQGEGGSSCLDILDRSGGHGSVSLSRESPGGGDYAGGCAHTLVKRERRDVNIRLTHSPLQKSSTFQPKLV